MNNKPNTYKLRNSLTRMWTSRSRDRILYYNHIGRNVTQNGRKMRELCPFQ
ncbi:hypothetical protein HanRHA438_Chr13g0620211 [Helianthus annuus]|nr:hypothetical protein HanRHA438_Chr13g0620211 [Helianthus annuus]